MFFTSILPKGLRPHQLTVAFAVLIVLFAIVYWIIDAQDETTNFSGVSNKNCFLEKLWFSTVTQSTVGYGDIYPKTMKTRLLAGIQIFSTLAIGLYLASYIDIRQTEVLDKADGKDNKAAEVLSGERDTIVPDAEA